MPDIDEKNTVGDGRDYFRAFTNRPDHEKNIYAGVSGDSWIPVLPSGCTFEIQRSDVDGSVQTFVCTCLYSEAERNPSS